MESKVVAILTIFRIFYKHSESSHHLRKLKTLKNYSYKKSKNYFCIKMNVVQIIRVKTVQMCVSYSRTGLNHNNRGLSYVHYKRKYWVSVWRRFPFRIQRNKNSNPQDYSGSIFREKKGRLLFIISHRFSLTASFLSEQLFVDNVLSDLDSHIVPSLKSRRRVNIIAYISNTHIILLN